MKKHLKAICIATAMVVLLCPAIIAMASMVTTHTHEILSRDTTVVEKLYTHSHYCEKNGRWDWWPCGVYARYKRVERYCIDCGQVIDSLSYTDYSSMIGESHQLEY